MIEKNQTAEHRCEWRGLWNTIQRGRQIKRNWRREFLEAKAEGIRSGKVIVLTHRDEFTGMFYRVNKNGSVTLLGSGHNRGAA